MDCQVPTFVGDEMSLVKKAVFAILVKISRFHELTYGTYHDPWNQLVNFGSDNELKKNRVITATVKHMYHVDVEEILKY